MEYLILEDENLIYEMSSKTVKFLVPYNYFFSLVKLNWNDILFAIENNYLTHQDAREYASMELSNNIDNSPQDIIDLVCLTPEEIKKFPHLIYPHINNLVKDIPEEEKQETKDKVMYIILSCIFENREKFKNPLRLAQLIYAQFDYPQSLNEIAGYISIGTDCFLAFPHEPSEEEIMKNWANYLEKEKHRFNKNL